MRLSYRSIRFRTGLLVSSDHKACLALDEAPVFIEFVDVNPHTVEDLDLLLERGPADFNLGLHLLVTLQVV